MSEHNYHNNTSNKLPQEEIGDLLDQLGIEKEDTESYTPSPKIEKGDDPIDLSLSVSAFTETILEDGEVVLEKLRLVEPDTYRHLNFVPRTRQLNVPTSPLGYKRKVEHYRRQRKLGS